MTHITVLTVHFNTPRMMEACIRSLAKQTPGCRVVVIDNSDKQPFNANRCKGIVAKIEVIDNTRGQLINFDQWLQQFPDRKPASSNYGSPKHCKTIDLCFDMLPDGFILMDSDVLFKRDITPLWDETKAWVGEPFLDTPKGVNVMRLLPFLCYVNVPMCREHGIRYFNAKWMWHLTALSPQKWHDTGAWFYRDCMAKQMPYTAIKTADYIEHYFHGSHTNLNGGMSEWLRKYRHLWI